MVEVEPIEPDSPCAKPLTSEATKVNEMVRVLIRAVCSPIPEDEPIEVVSISLRPMNEDVTIERLPDRALKSEVCSVKAEDEPIVPVRNSMRPLNRDVPRPIDPASDLPTPLVSEPISDSEPVKLLTNPLV